MKAPALFDRDVWFAVTQEPETISPSLNAQAMPAGHALIQNDTSLQKPITLLFTKTVGMAILCSWEIELGQANAGLVSFQTGGVKFPGHQQAITDRSFLHVESMLLLQLSL